MCDLKSDFTDMHVLSILLGILYSTCCVLPTLLLAGCQSSSDINVIKHYIDVTVYTCIILTSKPSVFVFLSFSPDSAMMRSSTIGTDEDTLLPQRDMELKVDGTGRLGRVEANLLGQLNDLASSKFVKVLVG